MSRRSRSADGAERNQPDLFAFVPTAVTEPCSASDTAEPAPLSAAVVEPVAPGSPFGHVVLRQTVGRDRSDQIRNTQLLGPAARHSDPASQSTLSALRSQNYSRGQEHTNLWRLCRPVVRNLSRAGA